METKTKLIFTPQLARHLLKKGFTIIDIKPSSEDKKKTVFVFRQDEGLYKAIKDYVDYVK